METVSAAFEVPTVIGSTPERKKKIIHQLNFNFNFNISSSQFENQIDRSMINS